MLQTIETEALPERISAAVMPDIRLAVPDDFPQLMEICRQMHQENGAVSVDWQGVAETISQGLYQQGAMIGVVGGVGAIEGALYLQISSFWYSKDVMLQELFAYVLPQFRKSNNAKALIDFAKRCGERFNVPVLIAVISNHRTQEKVRLYSRRLGSPAGAFFLVGARTGTYSESGDC